jgi:hypothetical protein
MTMSPWVSMPIRFVARSAVTVKPLPGGGRRRPALASRRRATAPATPRPTVCARERRGPDARPPPTTVLARPPKLQLASPENPTKATRRAARAGPGSDSGWANADHADRRRQTGRPSSWPGTYETRVRGRAASHSHQRSVSRRSGRDARPDPRGCIRRSVLVSAPGRKIQTRRSADLGGACAPSDSGATVEL